MLIGIIGFIRFNNIKNEYKIFEERYSGIGQHKAEIFTKVTRDYQFFFWGVDEKFESEHGYPEFSGEVQIIDKDNNVLLDTAFSVSNSIVEADVKRAQNGFYFYYSPPKDKNLKIIMDAQSGDYIDLEVHEDLPENLALKPPLFILIFIVGLIIFLRKKQKTTS